MDFSVLPPYLTLSIFRRGEGCDGEHENSAGLRLPGGGVQKMISGKYKLRIVWDLKDGPRRYGRNPYRPVAAVRLAVPRSRRGCSAVN